MGGKGVTTPLGKFEGTSPSLEKLGAQEERAGTF